MEHVSQRRQYVIDPAFQLRFILKFCAIVIVSSILVACGIFYFFNQSTTVAIENTKVIVKPTADFILPGVVVTLGIVAVFSSVIVAFLSLMSSHKIAGPVFRIQKELDLVRQGDLTRTFSIRNTDQLKPLARALGETTEVLREKHIELGSQCRSLSNFLDEKGLVLSEDDRDKLHHMLKDLYEVVNYFKV